MYQKDKKKDKGESFYVRREANQINDSETSPMK